MVMLKEKLKSTELEVRCFNIIQNEKDMAFGEKCGRLLICRNNQGQVAGEIKCPRCGALYDINSDYLILKRVIKKR